MTQPTVQCTILRVHHVKNERWSAATIYGERVLPMFKLYYGETAGVVAGLLLRYWTPTQVLDSYSGTGLLPRFWTPFQVLDSYSNITFRDQDYMNPVGHPGIHVT